VIPPIFTYAKASGSVVALLQSGTGPLRFWPFAEAPQKGETFYGLPYAVWQLMHGRPANYINQIPDADNSGILVDAYAETVSAARTVMLALRDAFEPFGYVTAYNGEERDQSTGLYRSGFTVEFWKDR
jgi:hypothetical protein